MSFKIKAAHLMDPSFIKGVQKLSGERLPFKHSWQLKSLATKLDEAIDKVRNSYGEIVKSNCVLDEKGDLVPNTFKEDIKGPDGKVMRAKGDIIPNSFTPKDDESEVKIQRETKEMMESDIIINHAKIAIEALNDIKLSADDLDMLEPILAIPKDIADKVIPLT